MLVVVAAGGFFGGMQYQKSQQVTSVGGRLAGGGRFGANRQNGSAVRGKITSADNGSITVQLRDGSSKIITISGSTSINKAVNGSKDDLKTGEQVMVFGNNNSDGSVTAQNIQLNPLARGGGNTSGTPAQGQ